MIAGWSPRAADHVLAQGHVRNLDVRLRAAVDHSITPPAEVSGILSRHSPRPDLALSPSAARPELSEGKSGNERPRRSLHKLDLLLRKRRGLVRLGPSSGSGTSNQRVIRPDVARRANADEASSEKIGVWSPSSRTNRCTGTPVRSPRA